MGIVFGMIAAAYAALGLLFAYENAKLNKEEDELRKQLHYQDVR